MRYLLVAVVVGAGAFGAGWGVGVKSEATAGAEICQDSLQREAKRWAAQCSPSAPVHTAAR
jgi:F0F1-type ATP synthase membrane subunit c/vacuolar-type H+-ATPase subunit K